MAVEANWALRTAMPSILGRRGSLDVKVDLSAEAEHRRYGVRRIRQPPDGFAALRLRGLWLRRPAAGVTGSHPQEEGRGRPDDARAGDRSSPGAPMRAASPVCRPPVREPPAVQAARAHEPCMSRSLASRRPCAGSRV